MRKILFFVCAMLTWLHTDVTAKTLVFSITAAAQENQTMIVRLAEIEVYPQYLKEYLEFANEVDRLSVEREPGVVCLFPMQSAEDSTRIRILEIYASEEAYQQHLKTDHFQKYKQGTLHMVKDGLRNTWELRPTRVAHLSGMHGLRRPHHRTAFMDDWRGADT